MPRLLLLPDVPGCVEEDPVEEDSKKGKAKVADEITDEASVVSG